MKKEAEKMEEIYAEPEKLPRDNAENDSDDESTRKFSSPESGAERLKQLPQKVCDFYHLVPIETAFNAFLKSLRNRCADCKTTHDKFSYEKMWMSMVFSICMDFRRDVFQSKSDDMDQTPVEIRDWMDQTGIIEILQTFIDVAQQNGHEAKNELAKQEENTESKNQRHTDNIKSRCSALQNRYHSFVDLYRRCTGTWKPPRVIRRTYPNSKPQSYRQDQDNRQGHSTDRTPYRKGSYHTNDTGGNQMRNNNYGEDGGRKYSGGQRSGPRDNNNGEDSGRKYSGGQRSGPPRNKYSGGQRSEPRDSSAGEDSGRNYSDGQQQRTRRDDTSRNDYNSRNGGQQRTFQNQSRHAQ